MRQESGEDIPGRKSNVHKGPEALSSVAYFREPQIEVFVLEEICRSASISQLYLAYGLVNCMDMGSLPWTLEVRDGNGGLNEKISEEKIGEEHVKEVNNCLVIVQTGNWEHRSGLHSCL